MPKVLTKECIGAIDKLNAIGDELKEFIMEREEVINLIKLALVSKRNLFFLGKTGQAKSFIIKEFNKRITGSNYMELLMNKMMDKDEIYGRLDIPELVNGNQKVITTGKLPESDIAFYDEIFKSNDLLLNTLLQSLNYEDVNLEGNTYPARHLSIFSASNEIPNFKNKEEDKILYPLYNRLHLKVVTNYIEKKDNFKKAIKMKRARHGTKPQATIKLNEIKILNEKVWDVEVSEEIDELVWKISKDISNKLNRPVSDRKLIESSIILQGYALLNKRGKVEPRDLKVLEYYLWESPEEIQVIREIIKANSDNPLKEKVMGVKSLVVEQLEDAYSMVDSEDTRAKNKTFSKTEKELLNLHSELESLKDTIKTDEDNRIIDKMLVEFENLYKELNEKFGYTYTSIGEMKERMGI
ncbi:AAA family ATPase [Senegalia massiliensis]|uniref:MoxR family ATPase n=1 Tax=Senegalia massiliensis TaxID=1720316 RepID=A0A845R1M4_9CLOT|nr:AAA family ATPase [Senegalia massiliensis]NBI07626.1 MoxR family ATPase [Senegalia massiliensis]